MFPQLTVTPLLLSASFFVLVISRYLDRQLRSFVHLIKSVTNTTSSHGHKKHIHTLAEVYRIISFFAFDGELLALAGGGVMPPIPPSVKAPKAKNGTDTMSESGASASKVKTKKEEASEKSGGKHYYGELHSPYEQIRTEQSGSDQNSIHIHIHIHIHRHPHTHTHTSCMLDDKQNTL